MIDENLSRYDPQLGMIPEKIKSGTESYGLG